MISCAPTRSIKIPFKDCEKVIITHKHACIRLKLEWPKKTGDNPNLMIHITDRPIQSGINLNETSVSYLQENQCLSPNLTQPFHHQQDNSLPRYSQPYDSAPLVSHTTGSLMSNISDHDDVSSTTTNPMIVNSIQSQFDSGTASIPHNHDAHTLPGCRSYLPSHNNIAMPTSNRNESHLNTPISSISPTSFPTRQSFDSNQSSAITYPQTISSLRPLVCTCLKPTIGHAGDCPAATLHRSVPNASNQLGMTPRESSSQQFIFDPRPQCHIPMHIPLAQVQGQSLVGVSQNFIQITNSFPVQPNGSSSITPSVVSQTPTFTDMNCRDTRMQLPPFDIDAAFPPNYQVNPNIPIKAMRTKSVSSSNTKPKKKQSNKNNSTVIRSNDTNGDQSSVYHQKNSPEQQQQQLILLPSSSPKAQNTNSSRFVSSPIHFKQNTPPTHEDSQTLNSISTGQTSQISMNDMDMNNTPQASSPSTTMVRSPVTLDVSLQSTNSHQITTKSSAIDRTIDEVARGNGHILLNNSSTSFVQGQNMPLMNEMYPSLPHAKPTSHTYPHPSQQPVNNMIQSSIDPMNINMNKDNSFRLPRKTDVGKKRNRSKSVYNKDFQTIHHHNSNSFTAQTSNPSSFQRPIFEPIVRSSTSNSTAKSASWLPTLPPGSTITNHNQQLLSSHHSETYLPPPHVDYHTDPFTDLDSEHHDDPNQLNPDDIQYNFDLEEDILPWKSGNRFNSSTPPPPCVPSQLISVSPSHQISTLSPTSKTPTLSTNVYEQYLSSSTPTLTWQENRVTSSVSTPPDLQNVQLSQQLPVSLAPTTFSHSHLTEHVDSLLSSQTPISSPIGTPINTSNKMSSKTNLHVSKVTKVQRQTSKTTSLKSNGTHNKTIKRQSNPTTKRAECTNCGASRLIDITGHEFPGQKGRVFECPSCGNNSMRSYISEVERRRRLALVATDHLSTVECQFCHQRFASQPDYILHLQNDHASNKPM